MSYPFTVGIHVDSFGGHPAAEEDGVIDQREVLGPEWTTSLFSRLDVAGFSYATLAGAHVAGSSPRLDPVQVAAFAGPVTSGLGLIPQIPVTYLEPFHTATQLISVDHATHGRAGWLVSTENSTSAAEQYGREALTGAELEQETSDVVAVARLLQDSWEDDAVIRDLPTGRYIDRDKLHYVNFTGQSFTVKGPAITPRPPQGQVPIVVPLDAATGVQADAVIVTAGPGVIEQTRKARELGATIVIADLEAVLDSRGESAGDRLARLDGHRPWQSTAERFLGSAQELAARLTELADVVDGVRLIPATLGHDLDELHYAVLPELISAKVFTPPTPTTTLRDTFGLPAADNVFASERN